MSQIHLLFLFAFSGTPALAPQAGVHAPQPSGDQTILSTSTVAHPAPDTTLEHELRRLVDDFRGRAGIYARRLPHGEEIAINADDVFPTASMIKIPLLVGLFAAMEEGRFQLMDELPYDEALATPGGGDVLNKLRSGETVTLWRLAGLMITIGDHVASRWIERMVGGANVNGWLADHGFEHTRVNSRVDGREEEQEAYGWGQSTPREMSQLLTRIRYEEVVSESTSRDMYRLISRNWWPLGAKSVIPPTVNVAAKAGAVSTAASEILLVNAPAGDYVVCIMSREDSSGAFEGGNLLIRSVSAAVWEAWGRNNR